MGYECLVTNTDKVRAARINLGSRCGWHQRACRGHLCMVTSFSLLCRDSLKHFFACVGCIDRHRQGISTTLSWVTNAFFRVQCVSCWSVVSRPEASKNSGLPNDHINKISHGQGFCFYSFMIKKGWIHQNLLCVLFYESSNSVTDQKRCDTSGEKT